MYTLEAPIETKRLVLRPFAPDDLDDLYATQSLPEVARYLYWNPRTREQVMNALETKIAQMRLDNQGDRLTLAVELPGATALHTGVIGDVSLRWHSIEHRQGEIGYVFNPAYHGHGYATEAVAALLDLAFNGVRLHRVYGSCDARNTASAALMRRLGMRQEAHFIQNEWFKGEWGDEHVFAVLEDEWRTKVPYGACE